jgi:hypothetical protein
MTQAPLAKGVSRGDVLTLPAKPYQAVELRRAD